MKAKILIIILLVILIGSLIIMGIFHDRVVASRDKGMAVDWNADHKIQGNVDFRYYAAENMLIESMVAWPPGPPAGQIIYRSDLKGLYIFDGTDWALCTLQTKTSYWSCGGIGFLPTDNTKEVWYYLGSFLPQVATNAEASVNLPHGAIITKVLVQGSDNADTWVLYRSWYAPPDINSQPVAAGVFNTETAVIAFPIVDNDAYWYYISTSSIAFDETIISAKITYTTLYD